MGLGGDELYIDEDGLLRSIKWKGYDEEMTPPPLSYQLPFGATLDLIRFEADAPLPTKAYARSAAFDLAAYSKRATVTIAPHTTKLIRTGIGLRPPIGHLIMVCSRSGLATRSVFVANGPGIVDPDYTGEIKVLLFNGGIEPFFVTHGDRIAQVLVLPLTTIPLREVASMPITDRGDKGFGSTGK